MQKWTKDALEVNCLLSLASQRARVPSVYSLTLPLDRPDVPRRSTPRSSLFFALHCRATRRRVEAFGQQLSMMNLSMAETINPISVARLRLASTSNKARWPTRSTPLTISVQPQANFSLKICICNRLRDSKTYPWYSNLNIIPPTRTRMRKTRAHSNRL